MKFFKRKTKKLEQRIESLESFLGLFYTIDSDDYQEHREEKHGYGRLSQFEKEIESLKKTKKSK